MQESTGIPVDSSHAWEWNERNGTFINEELDYSSETEGRVAAISVQPDRLRREVAYRCFKERTVRHEDDDRWVPFRMLDHAVELVYVRRIVSVEPFVNAAFCGEPLRDDIC